MCHSMFPLAILAWLCLSRALAQLLLPSQDPFYDEPRDVSRFKPGEIIRSRRIPKLQSSPIPIPMAGGYRYLYRTTDSLGKPVAAATTLLIPSNVSYPPKLLSYQIAYDAANIDCSPSYALLTQPNKSWGDRTFIGASLAQGWYVVTPDYEGLEAQYVAGVMSGQATLDSIRAVLGNVSSEHDISLAARKTRTAMWGYSGGALASEWATELQPRYAPDLKPSLVGAALGGLVPNISNLVLTVDGGPYVALSFLGLKGLASAYPKLARYVNRHIIPSKAHEFEDISSKCTIEAAEEAANMSIFSYFGTNRGLLSDPVPASVFREAGQMGLHGQPEIPLFVYKSEGDQFSAIKDTDNLVKGLCSHGANIEYQRDSVGDHNTQAITGGAMAFEWIRKQFSSWEAAHSQGCQIRNVTLTRSSVAEAKDLPPAAITFLQDELKDEGID